MPTRRSLSNNRNPSKKPDGQSDVVTLSPSAVDSLWACPVCWMLENRFAGPRMGSAATSFGSLIHAVAQQATEAGLDLPQKPHRSKRRGQHRRNHPMDDRPIQDPTWRPQRHRRPRGTVQGARQGREGIGRIAQHRHIFRQVEPYGIPVEQHRNHHRGNVGPCRSGTAVRRAIRLRRHPRRLQRHRRQRSDLPRRTHRHHGRARRRLAGNRHERPAHRTPVGQNRPS